MQLSAASLRSAHVTHHSLQTQSSLLSPQSVVLSRTSRRVVSSTRTHVVRAQQKGSEDGVVQFAKSIGLPVDEGLFGFRPFSEVWVGRLAMIGFLSSVIGEFLTGKGTLGQVGLVTPNPSLAATITIVATGATFYATWLTIFKADARKIDPMQAARYAKFFGLKAEEQAEEVAEGMKSRGDKISGENLSRNIQSGQVQTAADSAFDFKDRQQAEEAAADMKDAETRKKPQGPNQSLAAKADVLEAQQLNFDNEGLYYARRVELTNGRFAMIGFLTAIIIEAASGRGIISQCIGYLRLSGLLGEASGFR